MHDAFPQRYGRDLVALRDRIGVQQQEVAKQLGRHRVTLSGWEKADAKVSEVRYAEYRDACLAAAAERGLRIPEAVA